MSIAEQMGRILEKTSISTNIKERLDFSCALFDHESNLVANAPHMPVHLGSMSEAVKFQVKHLGSEWKEGETLMSNHPQAGGSHLPDITVITPVYKDNKVIFYLASRGHHADVGGITPGSMPSFSRYMKEEGIAINSFKIVEDGAFQEEKIVKLLTSGDYPTRRLKDNLSDLKAQVAANNKGRSLLLELVQEYNLQYVQKYMFYIQQNAENSVRSMLKTISIENNMAPIDAVQEADYMDDGSKIQLKLTINREANNSAHFDFTGTGTQVYGNTNTPKAVTYSAILYCLRCLVDIDIPLNQGCLNPVKITIPENSILNPTEDLAVVGGNVQTSQRITDVVFKAFRKNAASYGCMNNFTFGNDKITYYETIGGGSGAGENYDGQHGIQCHMTNTRITDPEILERRYPVILQKFIYRQNSGGQGQYNGGNGLIREIKFLQTMSVSILSERRSHQPYGIKGGDNGQSGLNIWFQDKSQVAVNIGGKNTIQVQKNDIITINTPGGGGYGLSKDRIQKQQQKQQIYQNYGSENKFKQLQTSN